MKYTWGNFRGEIYKPKVNRKKQLALVSGLLLTGLLPGPNFIGLSLIKFINPLWVYN